MHPGRAPNAKARNSDISISADDRGPRPICIMGSRKPRLVQKRKGKREWASAVSRGPGEETLDRKSVSVTTPGCEAPHDDHRRHSDCGSDFDRRVCRDQLGTGAHGGRELRALGARSVGVYECCKHESVHVRASTTDICLRPMPRFTLQSSASPSRPSRKEGTKVSILGFGRSPTPGMMRSSNQISIGSVVLLGLGLQELPVQSLHICETGGSKPERVRYAYV